MQQFHSILHDHLQLTHPARQKLFKDIQERPGGWFKHAGYFFSPGKGKKLQV
jgi:hypothetical protein